MAMKILKQIMLILLISGNLILLAACTDETSSNKSQNSQIPVNANQDEVNDKLQELENKIVNIEAIITEKDKQIQKLNDRIIAVEKQENNTEVSDKDNTSYEQLVIESIKVEFKQDNMMISFEVTNTKPYPDKGSDNYLFEVISKNANSKLVQIYIPNCQVEILQNGNAKFVLTMHPLPDDEVNIVMFELTTSRIAQFGCGLTGADV